MHGGDYYLSELYRNNKFQSNKGLDFSVNLNPLGPDSLLRETYLESVKYIDCYPDINCTALKEKLADKWRIPKEWIYITSGASEGFMAIANGRCYKEAFLIAPSFVGYRYALDSSNSMVTYSSYNNIINNLASSSMEKSPQSLWIANPNNPDGKILETEYTESIYRLAKEKKMDVIVDECFLTLAGRNDLSVINLMREKPSEYSHLICVRSFTKTYAMANLRVGYFVCTDKKLGECIAKKLPEWNVSGVSLNCAEKMLDKDEYLTKARQLIDSERERISDALKKKGFEVFPSSANFIMFRGNTGLKEKLLERGIMIRDCSDFEGLGTGYYRIAVRNSGENDFLIKALDG